jgi:hypothetical protein
MGDRRALLARQCSSDVDLRKRVPPTETHFRVGAFERAAQFQLTRAGWGLDISTVAPSQSLIAFRAACIRPHGCDGVRREFEPAGQAFYTREYNQPTRAC